MWWFKLRRLAAKYSTTNLQDSVVEEVLNIDVHKNKFEKFQGGKRAIMFFQGYFCRSVFALSEQVGSGTLGDRQSFVAV